MAAATEGAAGAEEADVVNPIVFFDITLGGEFEMKCPIFSLSFLYISISPQSGQCVHAFYSFFGPIDER